MNGLTTSPRNGDLSYDYHLSPSEEASHILPHDFYESLLSTSSKARKPSPIWDLFPVELRPGMISMLAGKPNPTTFPFESITLSVRSPNPRNDKTVTELVLRDEELAAGLQYNLTSGLPELNQWIMELMKEVHERVNNEGWRVSIGSGSQDILYKAFFALLNPGESILVEAPTYPGVIPLLKSLDCNAIEVTSDSEGICTTALAAILDSWDYQKCFPKLLYTVPFGSNPTGVTTSEARRIEILRLSRKYNFLILEDDPYYFLYYGSAPRPASYFKLERCIPGDVGRVLRLDSFSKIMAAGFRVGWATGPSRLLDAIELHSASSTVQPSSIGQVMLLKLFSLWGIPGFLMHTEEVADFYRGKRDFFNECLHRYMDDLAEWTTPDAAMFFWLRLSLPPLRDGSEGDSSEFIRQKCVSHGVLLLPGESTYLDERRNPCARVSFSLLSNIDMEEAIKRLASVLRMEWEQYNKCQASLNV